VEGCDLDYIKLKANVFFFSQSIHVLVSSAGVQGTATPQGSAVGMPHQWPMGSSRQQGPSGCICMEKPNRTCYRRLGVDSIKRGER